MTVECAPQGGYSRTMGDRETPDHLGHRARLRTRLLDDSDGLADYELVEYLLALAIPRRDTKPLAKALLTRFGSFAEVLGAPLHLLREVPGIGPSVALDLKLIAATAERMLRSEIRGRHVLSSWTQVIDYCRAAMGFEQRETNVYRHQL